MTTSVLLAHLSASSNLSVLAMSLLLSLLLLLLLLLLRLLLPLLSLLSSLMLLLVAVVVVVVVVVVVLSPPPPPARGQHPRDWSPFMGGRQHEAPALITMLISALPIGAGGRRECCWHND